METHWCLYVLCFLPLHPSITSTFLFASCLPFFSHAPAGEKERTKSELNAITDHFNISVENPCTIMMQDTAREFLNKASAKKKYEVILLVPFSLRSLTSLSSLRLLIHSKLLSSPCSLSPPTSIHVSVLLNRDPIASNER